MTSVCATSDGFATCGFDDKVRFVVKGAYTSTVVDVEGHAWTWSNPVQVSRSRPRKVLVSSQAALSPSSRPRPGTGACLATHNSLIAVGSKDGMVRVFDASLKEVFSSVAHRSQITALSGH